METRPKNYRQAVQPSCDSPKQGALNFLDTLSEEVQGEVVRWMSTKPHSSNWMSGISAPDIINLMRIGGGLGNAAASTVHSLNLASKTLAFRSEAGALEVLDTLDNDARTFLWDVVAPKLRTLQASSLVSANALTLSKCVALRKLTLSGDSAVKYAPVLLEASGTHLQQLRLMGSSMPYKLPSVIAESCSQLKLIQLYFPGNVLPLGVLWRSVGGTLEELILSDIDQHLLDAPALTEFCTKLVKLHLGFNRISDNMWVCDLGAKLKELRLYIVHDDSNQLKQVLLRCPLLMLDVNIRKNFRKTVQVAGRKIFSMDVVEGCTEVEALRRAGAICTNLKKLCYATHKPLLRRIHFFQAFFVTPKPLREVSIALKGELEDIQTDVLDALAGSVGSLEQFSWFSKTQHEAQEFGTFFNATPSLKGVLVKFESDKTKLLDRHLENFAVALMNKLRVCTKLVSVSITNKGSVQSHSEIVADACNHLPPSMKEICVGNCWYGQPVTWR